jgi:hypothetical protein
MNAKQRRKAKRKAEVGELKSKLGPVAVGLTLTEMRVAAGA